MADTNRAVQPQKMARDFKFQIEEPKTNVLFNCAVTAQLTCVIVFAYAKSRFSYDAAQKAS